MKIAEIGAFNFKNYSKVIISLDENVTYFVGKNGSGKTGAGVDIIWATLCGISEKATKDNPIIGERFRYI